MGGPMSKKFKPGQVSTKTKRIRLKPFPFREHDRTFDLITSMSLWAASTFLLVGTIGMLCCSGVSQGHNHRRLAIGDKISSAGLVNNAGYTEIGTFMVRNAATGQKKHAPKYEGGWKSRNHNKTRRFFV